MWQVRKDTKERGITGSGFNVSKQCGFCSTDIFSEGNEGVCNSGEERQRITE